MADGNGNGNGHWTAFWRTLALMAVTALLSGFSAWMLFDRDQPTRGEVTAMNASMASDVQTLRNDVSTVRGQLERINGKLDVWLNSIPREREPEPPRERRR